MAIVKPDISQQWASDGDKIAPSGAKIQAGWGPEIPPYQWENFIQNRQDEMLAYLNERGIPEWDNRTNYLADGKSYVQGSDGVVYKSVAASGPNTSVQSPITDPTGIYWEEAFADADDVRLSNSREWVAETVSQAEAEAGTSTTRRAWTAQRVFQAFRGVAANATEALRGSLRVGTQPEVDAGVLDNVAVTPKKLSHGLLYSFGANGYFFLPSWLTGFGFQWGVAANGNISNGTLIPFPLAFPAQCFGVVPIALAQGVIQGIETAYVGDWNQDNFLLATQVQSELGGAWQDGPVPAFWLAIGR